MQIWFSIQFFSRLHQALDQLLQKIGSQEGWLLRSEKKPVGWSLFLKLSTVENRKNCEKYDNFGNGCNLSGRFTLLSTNSEWNLVVYWAVWRILKKNWWDNAQSYYTCIYFSHVFPPHLYSKYFWTKRDFKVRFFVNDL